MTKAEREHLAREVIDEIKRLGIQAEVQGYWVVLSPPSKVPFDLSMRLGECSDEVAVLIQQSA